MHSENPDSLYGIFTQVIRVHYRRMRGLLERIGAYPGQPPLLFILGKHEGSSQKELANLLHIKAATITVMLRRMEKGGLVERVPDSSDQRVTRVYFSEKGKKLRDQVLEELKVIEAECFQGFTVEEQLLMRRLLMQVKDNLNKACGRTDK